jgi:hypothetical protein
MIQAENRYPLFGVMPKALPARSGVRNIISQNGGWRMQKFAKRTISIYVVLFSRFVPFTLRILPRPHAKVGTLISASSLAIAAISPYISVMKSGTVSPLMAFPMTPHSQTRI